MCSSGFVSELNPLKQASNLNKERRKLEAGWQRKVLGGQTLSEATGFNSRKSRTTLPVYKTPEHNSIAIGTQTGGTRKPLGSTSGLNT